MGALLCNSQTAEPSKLVSAAGIGYRARRLGLAQLPAGAHWTPYREHRAPEGCLADYRAWLRSQITPSHSRATAWRCTTARLPLASVDTLYRLVHSIDTRLGPRGAGISSAHAAVWALG